jgi:hypothetical protein
MSNHFWPFRLLSDTYIHYYIFGIDFLRCNAPARVFAVNHEPGHIREVQPEQMKLCENNWQYLASSARS